MTDQARHPQVSVLLACYQPRWLDAAIDSVLAQTFTDFELLVLDDSNLPEVRDLVLATGDARIRYLGNPVPLGPAGNHDRGLQEARGRYIAIINHDDLWKPQLLTELVARLEEHPDAVVAFARHDCVDGDGVLDLALGEEMDRTYGRAELAPGLHRPFVELAVTRQALPMAQCAVWRVEACPRIPAQAYGAYDWWLGYALSRNGAGAVYCPESLSQWRVHADNLTSSPSTRKQRGSVYVARTILKDDAVASEHRNLRKKYLRMRYHLVRGVARSALRRPHA